MAASRSHGRHRAQIVRRMAHNSESDDDLFFFPHQFPRGTISGQSLERVGRLSCEGEGGLLDTPPNTPVSVTGRGEAVPAMGLGRGCSSLMDGLLFDIYDRWHYRQRDSFDSDTFTECSSTSDALFGRSDSVQQELDQRHSQLLNPALLQTKGINELQKLCSDLQHRISHSSAQLIRQLKRRDRRLAKRNKNNDVITAIIQASSLKRRIDTRMRFTVDPLPGEIAFQQWCDAMKAVARLPIGIPPEFRKNVWLSLADNHLFTLKLDWDKTVKFAFNEKTNPDDNNLGMQIVKDLHRTGCSGFSGHDNAEDRAVLKRVLLAYARWNKAVGYCQGFNVLSALVLDVMDRKEDDALKVLIYLIDHVLPDSYFANNLKALSVDMAVFRDLLRVQNPQLSTHLDHLQAAAGDNTTGANYEPPLTNVFTMQWFLTLFATCLPQATALRVWDSVLLEGSEVLLRTALAIWGKLSERIMAVQSADGFYTTMGVLTQEMLDDGMVDADQLIKEIYSVAPFPFPQLDDLREKYTYNITPFSATMSTGRPPQGRTNVMLSDDDELDEEDLIDQVSCFTGMFPQQVSPSRNKPLGAGDRAQSGSSYDISKVSPGAYAATPENSAASQSPAAYMERMTMDIDQLNRQYRRLRERQKQAHIILAAASAKHLEHQAKARSQSQSQEPRKPIITGVVAPPIQSPVAVNHLFIGRKNGSSKRNRHVAVAPSIAPFYPKGGGPTQLVSIQGEGEGPSKVKDAEDIAKIRRDYLLQRQKSLLSSQKSQIHGDKLESTSKQPIDDKKYNNNVEASVGHEGGNKCVEPCKDPTSKSGAPGGDTVGASSTLSTNGKVSDAVGQTGDHLATKTSSSCLDTEAPDLINLQSVERDGTTSKDSSPPSPTDGRQHTNAASVECGSPNCEEDNASDHDQEVASVPCSGCHEGPKVTTASTSGSNLNVEKSDVFGKPTRNAEQKKSGELSQPSLPRSHRNSSQPSPMSSISKGADKPGKPTLLQLAQEGVGAIGGKSDSWADQTLDSGTAQQNIEHARPGVQGSRSRSSSSVSSSDGNSSCETLGSTPTSPTGSKIFNPFPSRLMNAKRAQNGLRLGLYASDSLPVLDNTNASKLATKNIGRSQLNACLQRQYIAEMKQQSKHGK